MTHRFSCLLASAALATIMSLPTAAQEYSNGGKGAKGRVPATSTPVEAYGVHPPGLAPADARHWKPYAPYYAPLSPVASSTRWRPWAYYPLLPYYTPYYLGYCPHRLFNPPPRPYGSNGWGTGPMPEVPIPEEPGTTPLDFGPYSSVVADDTIFWNMGGNGLVPYGAAPSAPVGPPDLVDAIQASRPRRRGHAHFRRAALVVPPAVILPQEPSDEQRQAALDADSSGYRLIKPAEPIPPGKASREHEDDLGTNRSSRRTKRAPPNRGGVY